MIPELSCMKCGSIEQLTYTYHQRHDVICEPCRSKVSDKRRNGKFLSPNKKQQKWHDFANKKNSDLSKKYNHLGNRV